MNDESGERVSVDLYQKVHTIARLVAALQAQVLQAEEGRSGGGSVSVPAVEERCPHPLPKVPLNTKRNIVLRWSGKFRALEIC